MGFEERSLNVRYPCRSRKIEFVLSANLKQSGESFRSLIARARQKRRPNRKKNLWWPVAP